jgi:hypothetical protein
MPPMPVRCPCKSMAHFAHQTSELPRECSRRVERGEPYRRHYTSLTTIAGETGDAAWALTGVVHCAIYTRKSTDEGLEQSFNTLDAQREAAESFVNSQRHEGWVPLQEKYDDGGYKGRQAGGKPTAKNGLYNMLTNMIYTPG